MTNLKQEWATIIAEAKAIDEEAYVLKERLQKLRRKAALLQERELLDKLTAVLWPSEETDDKN